MSATALATIAAFEMIGRSEHEQTLLDIVIDSFLQV